MFLIIFEFVSKLFLVQDASYVGTLNIERSGPKSDFDTYFWKYCQTISKFVKIAVI